MKKIFIFLFLAVLFALHLSAQTENKNNPKADIFENLRAIDPQNYATVKVFQDERIETIFRKQPSLAGLQTIYRVQVFSSNVQRTAKSEAYSVEKMLREEFPEHAVFMSFVSPFWKVKIGEFGTRESAQLFRDQIVKSFPQMRNQTYVVPERQSQNNK